MGDKGGKKDKDKSQKQRQSKHDKQKKKKLDNRQAEKPHELERVSWMAGPVTVWRG